MPTLEQFELVMKFAGGFRRPAGERVREVTIPLSVIVEVARNSLETSAFFPPDLCPADLGDGALIERCGKRRFRVHERFETGQMRFSDISARSYWTLRGAVRRYLAHYRPLFLFDRVRIVR